MNKVENMRAFIIKFVYVAIWAGIVYVALKYAMPLFMPFVVAFIISFALRPLIDKIAGRLPFGRKLVAIVVLILAYLVLGTLIAFLVSSLIGQIGSWFAELPRFYRVYIVPAAGNVGDFLDSFIARLDPAVAQFLTSLTDNLSNTISGFISSVSSGAVGLISSMATRVPLVLVGAFLAIIASFFFVVDYYKITHFFKTQMSGNVRRRLRLVRDYVVNVLWRFARAYLMLMTLTFVEVSIGLVILGIENTFLIAFFTAIVDILPVLGTGTIMIPWMLYSLFSGETFLGIGLLVLYVVITVVRQTLEPRVVGKQIGLYPLLTLIGMFIGAQLFGIWGMFGFPVALTVVIYLNRIGEISLFKAPSSGAPTSHDIPGAPGAPDGPDAPGRGSG